MKKSFYSINTITNGAQVLRLIGELARVHHKKLSLNSLELVLIGFEELTIKELHDGIMYCYDKGLVSCAEDGSVYPSLDVASLVEGKLLEAMGLALENICIVRDGVLEYEDFIEHSDFMEDDNKELLYAVLTYDLPEESVSALRELLLKWHLVRMDGIGNIIVE